MNRSILLIVVIVATLTLPAGASACDGARVKAVIAKAEAPVAVVAISSLPEFAQGITEWIELPEIGNEISEIAEAKAISIGTRALCVTGEGESCRTGVLLTVAKALGKAALRGMATVIHGIV